MSLLSVLEKMFGSQSKKEVKKLMPLVEQIEALEEAYRALSDHELIAKTDEFKGRLAKGETLDDILPEAFATVREASDRVLGMRHFKVQLIGGVVLHQGRIAEMKTGEGKTLVSTLPAYLNALSGNGVHIVTVNDYLAKRDSEWMGKVHRFLGLSIGLVYSNMEPSLKSAAYMADITYATNNELGFDYLRDNMVIYKENMAQRGQPFAIIDEVDSILIDEARTPLIISGMGEKSTQMYEIADRFARNLKYVKKKDFDLKEEHDDIEADYLVDEKAKTVVLAPRGIGKAERAFNITNLSDPENMTIQHHINQAIRAHGLMKNEIDYVVKDGEVLIVDEFTGRLMIGRRYSEGLHQAIEAKEGVKVERESKTLATITFQNYFRLYKKLSGMTGTALTEESEFREIYKLDVVEIPTNMDMIRQDYADSVYKNEQGKYRAVIKQITECHEKGQPVLVGTISIEKSELLAAMLKRNGVPHHVLNAKYHEKEAFIVAQAGKKSAVTIATNMAGRGTDIMLGGNAEYIAKQEMEKSGYTDELINESTSFGDTDNEQILEARQTYAKLYAKHKVTINIERDEVVAAGGLFIIGTERHESRRIDNQLRGRAGRQGDPGASRFFISLEDDLMRLFGSERIGSMVDALGLEEDDPIEHGMLTNAIENAQKKVEGRNFEIRKHVLQYDEVMNQQRSLIYGQRQKVLDGEDLKPVVTKMIEDVVKSIVHKFTAESPHPDYWDLTGLIEYAESFMLDKGELAYTREDLEWLNRESLENELLEKAMARYDSKEEAMGSENMRELERVIMLQVVDTKWMDHIDLMDQLRHGISMRAYAQRDPVVEYKFEGFEMFEEMIESIRDDAVRYLLNAKIEKDTPPQREQVATPTQAIHGDGTTSVNKTIRKGEKIGRNDPCPCGSGKKYKKCCGQ